MDVRSLIITPQFLKLIAEVDEFKGRWKEMRSLTPDRLQSLKHVAMIESIGSSTRIEGAKLSDAQVEALLNNVASHWVASHWVASHAFESRDEQEVIGYAECMDLIYQSHADIPLTENYIKQLHSTLLRHSTKDERHRGEYKTSPNHVEAFDADGSSLGVIFETTSAFDTPKRMEELLKWTRETLEDNSLHPLMVIGVFAVVFLAIHPFQDGNGRLSRVLTSLLLLRAGYSYIPYASLERIIEKNKKAYYLGLRCTQATLGDEKSDWVPWLRFYLTALKRQKDHLAAKLETQIEQDYQNLPPESVMILEYVTKHGRITTKQADQLLKAPRPTVKLRLKQLVAQDHLTLHGKGRGSYYEKG